MSDSYLEEYLDCEFFEERKSGDVFNLCGLPFKKIDSISAIALDTPEDQPNSIYGYNETTNILHFVYFEED